MNGKSLGGRRKGGRERYKTAGGGEGKEVRE